MDPATMGINNYLNKDFPCGCGRVHRTDLRIAEVSAGALRKLPQIIASLGCARPFLLADENTWAAAGGQATDILKNAGIAVDALIFKGDGLVPDESAIGQVMLAFPSSCDLILPVGTGSIGDIGRFASFRLGVPFATVATAPSMDGFVSSVAAMVVSSMKTDYEAQAPRAIVADLDVLCRAPMPMIAAGVGDILGKYSSLCDWKIAHIINGEYYCDEIAGMMREAIRRVVSSAEGANRREPEAIRALTEGLILSGIAMDFSGNSHPVSGGGHHLSHYWKMRFLFEGRKAVLHGAKVGIGAVAALKLYQMLLETPVDFAAARENARGQVLDRLDAAEREWGGIQSAIRGMLPPPEEIENILLGLGAPINPLQAGVGPDAIRDAVGAAKEPWDRYTVPELLHDLGLLEGMARRVTDYFADGQAAYARLLRENARERLKRVKCFVLDLDGTFYLGEQLFPFSKAFLEAAEKSGRKTCFFTNNSSKDAALYVEKLAGLGITAGPERMLVSSDVLIEHLLAEHPGKSAYVVGTPPLVEGFRKAGIPLDGAHPDMVVLGFDTTLDYAKIHRACGFIREGCLYYGVNPDLNCPVEGGAYMPDCGAIAGMVEASTGRHPEFFGKPSRHALEYIARKTGCGVSELAFVGDRLYTDIAIAHGTQALSILVLTGESTREDAMGSATPPDIIADSLAEVAGLLG